MIDEAGPPAAESSWPTPGQDEISRVESEAIDRALDSFFALPRRFCTEGRVKRANLTGDVDE